MALNNNSAIPVHDKFWAMVAKADCRFARVLHLPIFGRNRNDHEFSKAFKLYTQLWKMQQENRQKLIEAGMKRWEVGEIASRIAQLYYGQYQRSADSECLSDCFIFYEAILDRDYFGDNSSNPGSGQEMIMLNKQLRFLARYITVCLVIGRRDRVMQLSTQLKSLIDESKKNFQDAEYKEWKHVIQEICRFMKIDDSFMNSRSLRYSYLYDTPPNSIHKSKRGLVLRDSLLTSYYATEVKYTELSIDAFRMLQSVEWDPHGSFAEHNKKNSDFYSKSENYNTTHLLLELKDVSLPPNPLKTLLYRPSASHFLSVLATKCEELPLDGIMFVYISASGDNGVSSETSSENLLGSFENLEINPPSSPNYNCFGLWLGSRAIEGSNFIYPSDLVPFTRRPLFLIIDSPNAFAFKIIYGEEKGETPAMLLSPAVRYDFASVTDNGADPTRRTQSQFTMFLTAPLQAFWYLTRNSSDDFDTEKYTEAEKLLLESLTELEDGLIMSSDLDPVWTEVLGDPFLRRFLLRFIFCRAAIGLFRPTSESEDFLPACFPLLPESVNVDSPICRYAIRRVARFLEVTEFFKLYDGLA